MTVVKQTKGGRGEGGEAYAKITSTDNSFFFFSFFVVFFNKTGQTDIFFCGDQRHHSEDGVTLIRVSTKGCGGVLCMLN